MKQENAEQDRKRVEPTKQELAGEAAKAGSDKAAEDVKLEKPETKTGKGEPEKSETKAAKGQPQEAEAEDAKAQTQNQALKDDDGNDQEAKPEAEALEQDVASEKAKRREDEYKEKIKELEDARMRQLAEFDNFRKRSEKEKTQMFEVGAKSVVEKILPVIDNFERGLGGVTEEEKGSPFVEGIEMIYKQMLTALEEIHVKPIEAVGKPFDPNFHNAVMTVEDDSLESGTVAEELQKGYMYQDSVVRHSMVKVVQ